jgi:hypothetical protein
MEEFFKVILWDKGFWEILSGKEILQQMHNICLESYL